MDNVEQLFAFIGFFATLYLIYEWFKNLREGQIKNLILFIVNIVGILFAVILVLFYSAVFLWEAYVAFIDPKWYFKLGSLFFFALGLGLPFHILTSFSHSSNYDD